jgi:DNA modification methylase
MIGALQAGWEAATGIELDPEYARIANARIAHWL